MSAIAAILLDTAVRIGAPLLKEILTKQVGGTAGEIGGTVIDVIAEKAGVKPEELPSLPAPQLEAAVQQAECDLPQIMMAALEAQREGNKLQLAEMQKDSGFGWLWRPAGMWLMLGCIAWYVMVRPMINAALWAMGTGVQIEIGLDVATFITIFTVYTGLYMGGNTLLRSVKR
jgi:hypothetical protein